MAKLSDETIQQIYELYKQCRTYKSVAEKLGISASTVSRYIKERQSIKTYTKCDIIPIDIPFISRDSLLSFSELTPEEATSLDEWYKEYNK